ncbi:hypothetical protein K402DRAFT_232467 [Aulographum hederae CBS 113979]|uniref:Uncharacterized protein n=1 Tax=Aulographum hederae CBS 113979 TaxID=1176131 RepID=A0A6G1GKX4_9PEZI|nr:hypothetical protein K402DRAFT_232467 [Aulographum hederae CBS 113979]
MISKIDLLTIQLSILACQASFSISTRIVAGLGGEHSSVSLEAVVSTAYQEPRAPRWIWQMKQSCQDRGTVLFKPG